MLFVIVGVGQDRYAISAREIVAVAPNADARRIPGAARSVVGLIQYRNRPIPLLDFGELCRGTACVETPTTRILIVERGGSGAGLLGIRAEHVTSTTRMDSASFDAPGVLAASYITGVTLVRSAFVLRIDLQRLLQENASDLFALQDTARNGSIEAALARCGSDSAARKFLEGSDE